MGDLDRYDFGKMASVTMRDTSFQQQSTWSTSIGMRLHWMPLADLLSSLIDGPLRSNNKKMKYQPGQAHCSTRKMMIQRLS
jgi:hypothetical protein